VLFFTEQREIVAEVFSFFDPPVDTKYVLRDAIRILVTGAQARHPFVQETLRTDTFDQENECNRRNRHRYRHIQYHNHRYDSLPCKSFD